MSQSNTSTQDKTLSVTFGRIVLNKAVVPLSDLPECSKKLQGSTAAKAGLCSLASFVESQAFAQAGGDWENCVKKL
ncbi:hypothetical protein BDY24DRAFT_417192 [Mrakia frigida]|uniref:uncharacterized protein n=1 Tax=Mrakia frigida TaxID=29902 RepID=UPI003FCC1282